MAGSVGSEEGDYGFQIAPMVDVVFVLLLFFMSCAGMQIVEKELTINLPSGRGVAKAGDIPKTPIIIEIGADGQVSANDQTFGTATDKTIAPLREFLKNAIEQFGPDNPVIIRPASEARHERVMDVLNAAAASGVKNLTFG
jgi:biopolymer transport protein ExbD